MYDWIETPAGRKRMKKIARRIIGYARANHFHDLLGYNLETHEPEGDVDAPESLVRDIQAELTAYSLENAKVLSRLASLAPNRYAYLQRAFLNRCIERQRMIPGTFHNLYRNTRDKVRQAPDLDTFRNEAPRGAKRKSPLHIGFAGNGVPAGPLDSEDLAAIPMPPELRPENASRLEAVAVQALARHFLEEVRRMLGEEEPVRVEHRLFVHWLLRHLPAEAPEEVSLDAPAGPGPNAPSRVETEPAPEPLPWFDPALVARWAAAFARGVKAKAARVFHRYKWEDRTLEEIAREEGYAQANGPQYVVKKTEEKLKSFLRDKPWLVPDDGDFSSVAFDHFLEILGGELKKRRQSP